MISTSVLIRSELAIFKANLYLKNDLGFALFRNLIDKAFWPIFGEMKILDELTDLDSCQEENNCPEEYGIVYSYLALMFYMIFANILLLNLLIAMFRLVNQF